MAPSKSLASVAPPPHAVRASEVMMTSTSTLYILFMTFLLFGMFLTRVWGFETDVLISIIASPFFQMFPPSIDYFFQLCKRTEVFVAGKTLKSHRMPYTHSLNVKM